MGYKAKNFVTEFLNRNWSLLSLKRVAEEVWSKLLRWKLANGHRLQRILTHHASETLILKRAHR